MKTCLPLLALALIGCAKTTAPVTPAPSLPEGRIQVAVGPATATLIYRSANAEQAIWSGDRVYQRTAGGVVLVRRAADLSLLQVLLAPAPVAVMGLGPEGRLLAGLEGGAVGSFGEDGAWAATGALDATPVWVGVEGGQAAAVSVTLDRKDPGLQIDVLDQGTHHRGALHAPPFMSATGAAPSTVAEVAGDVWMGYDWGEWGGALCRVHLSTGNADFGPEDGGDGMGNVAGMVSSRGALWVTGGGDHMGMASGYVVRIDASGTKAMYSGDNYEPEARTGAGGPVIPIHHLRPWPDAEDWLALAFSEVYRVSPDFKTWTRLPDLEVHYMGGRPDAVGTYASVTDLQLNKDGLSAVATRNDGIFAVDAAGHAVGPEHPDALAGGIRALVSTPQALLMVGEAGAAALDSDGLAPVYGVTYDWAGNAWDWTPEGQARVTVFTGSKVRSGPRVQVRTIPPPENAGMSLFFGTLPLVVDGAGHLYTYKDHVAQRWNGQSWDDPRPVATPEVRWNRLRTLPGVADVLLDIGGKGQLLQWGDQGFVGLGPASGVKAALGWDDGHLLVALDQGLQLVALAGGEQSPAPIGDPGFPVQGLARDGCGRVWLLGEKVDVWTGGALHRLPDTNGIAGRSVQALTGRPTGVAWTDGQVVVDLGMVCDAAVP